MSGSARDRANEVHAKVSSVDNKSARDISGQAVQANVIHGDIKFSRGTDTAVPMPAQLPSPGFIVDRGQEIQELRQQAESADPDGPPTVVVITGLGGVGKTTLALHWLHEIRSHYQDGQLFVDLGGFSGSPLTPGESLERFLRALGVTSENIPMSVDEQATLFRSLTTGKRIIALLDNAASAAQVRPLLPGPGPALVVVTTRRRLPGLALSGAHFVDLTPLGEAGALQLLDHLLGTERTRAELSSAQALVELCGRLPLAVCASGARLATRRRWPIARIVKELADEGRRLEALSVDDDISVRAAFDISYRALSDRAARLYRLLGQHPGPDFGIGLAGALLEVDDETAADLLDLLVSANLIEEESEDRFRFHDLLRLHAQGKLAEIEPDSERRTSFGRELGWFLNVAVSADLAVNPNRWRLGPRFSSPPDIAFSTSNAALDCLETELDNITAVLRQALMLEFDTEVWQICEALWGLFIHRRRYRAWIETHELGITAAEACGNRHAEARMRAALGHAYLSFGDPSKATEHCEIALRVEEEIGHRRGQASVLEYLGLAQLSARRPGRALDRFRRARDLHEELGHPRGVALMTRRIGEALTDSGNHSEALKHFRTALRFFTVGAERYHHAATLCLIGEAHLASDHPELAEEPLRAALEIFIDFGDQGQQANVHVALARLAADNDDHDGERNHLEQALTIYEGVGDPLAEQVGARLNRRSDPSAEPPNDAPE